MHAFNDANNLFLSKGHDVLNALCAKLKGVAARASPASIAAGTALLAALPGLNIDGSVRAVNVVPPSPQELATSFPDAFTGDSPTVEEYALFRTIFTAPVVNRYGNILPGLAHAVEAVIAAGVVKLLASKHSGDFNIAAAHVLPAYYCFARDSPEADALNRYIMHYTLLCYFHVWKAIDLKLTCVESDIRGAVSDALRNVVTKGASWQAFKERFVDKLSTAKVQVDSSESGESGEGGRIDIFDYFEKHWLSPRWWSTVSGQFRALIETFGINTTNDVELFWYVRV